MSKLREQLQDLTGVDIMLDEHTFKSTYQIIKEISEVWENLSDASQANVVGLIAGKRNANVVQALMTNFQDAESAMKTAMESSGSAFLENEKYLDSIAGKVDILKGQFQAFSNSVISSGTIKFFVDLASGILKAATALNQIHLLLPMITVAAGAIIGRGLVRDVTTFTAQITAFASTGKTAADVATTFGNSIRTLSVSQKALLAEQLKSTLVTKEQGSEYAQQVVAVLGLETANNGLAASNAGLATSFKAVWASLGPIGHIAIIASTVVSVLSMVIPAVSQIKEKAIEASDEIVDNFTNAKNEYEKNVKSIDSIRARYTELANGVDNYGKNVSLTASEYEEFNSLLNQLIDISPGIASSYNTQSEAAIEYANAVAAAREEQEKLFSGEKGALEDYLGSGDTLFEGRKAKIDKVYDSMESIGEELYRAIDGGYLDIVEALREIGSGGQFSKAAEEAIESGASFFSLEQAFGSSYDDLQIIYENRRKFENELRETGRYTEEKINAIDTAIYKLAGPISKLDKAEADQVDYLMERIKAESGDLIKEGRENEDFFTNIPVGALDEFQDALFEINDSTATLGENLKNANEFGERFAAVFATDAAKELSDLAKGLRDGEGDVDAELEEYNSKVEELINSYTSDPILQKALYSYFTSFTDGVREVGDAAEETIPSVVGLKEALEQLKSGYDILSKAKADIFENGGLSNDTIKSIQDALKENEKLTDFLYVENGLVKLNEEAWNKRTEAIARGDIEAKKAQLDILLLEDSYSESRDSKQIEERRKKIAELRAEIEIYEAALASALEDPLNLSTMFSDLENVKGDASTLLDALDDLGEGHLQNWAELAEKFPELMEFDGIDTVEGQKAAIGSILDDIEAQYDSVLTERANALKELRDQEDALGHDTTVYDTLIANIEALTGMSLRDIIKGVGEETDTVTDSLNALSEAISNAQSAQEVLDDITAGEKSDLELLSEVIELAKKANKPIEDFVAGFNDGKIQFKDDAIGGLIDTFLKDIEALEKANPEQYSGLTEYVKQMIGEGDVEAPLEKLKGSLDEVEKVVGLISDVAENGVDLGTVQTLQELFGENWEAYIWKDSDGNYSKIATEALRNYINAQLDAQGVTGGLRTIIDSMFESAINGAEDATSAIEGLSDAVFGLQSAMSLRSSIRNGGDPLDVLDKLFDIAKDNEGINLTDLIQFGEDGRFDFTKSEAALNEYIDSLLDYETLVKQFPELKDMAGGEEFVSNLRNAVKAEVDANEESERLGESLSGLSAALSNAGAAGQILSDIASGEKSDFEIFQDVISLAETAGEDVSKYITSFDAQGVHWNTDALRQARTEFLATIQAFEDEHPEFAGITQYLESMTEAEQAATTFSDAMGKVNNVLDLVRDTAKNGISLDTFGKARELFGEDWQSYFNYDEAGNAIGINIAKTYEFLNAQIEAGNMTAQEAELIRQSWVNAARGIDEATSGFDALTNAISGLQSVTQLLGNIDSGNGSMTDMLNQVIDIAKNGNIDLSKLLTFDSGAIGFNREAIAEYQASLFTFENLKDKVPGITEEIAAGIQELVLAEAKASAETEKFNNALSNIGKARGVIENIRSGDGDIVSMLQTAGEMAALSGGSFADFFTTVGGELKWSEEAVAQWAETWIQSLEGAEGVTPEILASLREYVTSITGTQDAYTTASEGINHVLDAIKSSVSELGVNNEQMAQLVDRYKDLAGYSPEKLFEKTSMGVHLNVAELERLEDAYQRQERAGHEAELQKLQQEYQRLTSQINDTSDATVREQLFADRQEVADKISALHTLASQYDALTSKYNMWKQAQSMGEEGDMYDDIAGSLEDIKKLYDEGLIGTNKFRKAVQLMTNEDLTGKSAQELKQIYKDRFPNLERYFKEGKEASKGLDNLFSDIEKAGERVGKTWAWKDEDGGWQFQADNLDEVAEEIGISGELLELALRKIPDLGGTIDLTGYGEGVEKFAGDTESAIEEIKNSKEELDESFANGEIDTRGYVDAWEELDRYQKKLEEIQSTGGGEAEKPIGIDEAMEQIEQLKAAVETMTGIGIEIPVTITGDIEMLEKIIAGGLLPEATPEEEVQIPAEIMPKLEEYDTFDPMDIPARLVPEEEPEMPEIEVEVTPKIKQEEPASPSVSDEEVTVKYNTDTSEPDDYSPDDEDAQVVYGVDDSKVQSYDPPDKSADVNYTPDFTKVLTATVPELKGKVKYTADTSGINLATGTANAGGTAYKNGNGALKNDVFALSGELGPELVVFLSHAT